MPKIDIKMRQKYKKRSKKLCCFSVHLCRPEKDVNDKSLKRRLTNVIEKWFNHMSWHTNVAGN